MCHFWPGSYFASKDSVDLGIDLTMSCDEAREVFSQVSR